MMKKAWDQSAVPAPTGPSYDGIYLSHNEWRELIDDGVRPLSAREADTLRSSPVISEDDAKYIQQRDVGFNRVIWTCPLSLLEKAHAALDPSKAAQAAPVQKVPHLRLAHG